MKLRAFCTAFLAIFLHPVAQAKLQSKRAVAQVPPAAAGAPPVPIGTTGAVPPPPGPPPDFIDDETEFDDGDDLPEDYPPNAQRPGIPVQPPGSMIPGGPPPFPPVQGQAASPPPMPPPRAASYENDRPRLTGGKLHFKVVKDEFAVKGEKRERGKIEPQL